MRKNKNSDKLMRKAQTDNETSDLKDENFHAELAAGDKESVKPKPNTENESGNNVFIEKIEKEDNGGETAAANSGRESINNENAVADGLTTDNTDNLDDFKIEDVNSEGFDAETTDSPNPDGTNNEEKPSKKKKKGGWFSTVLNAVLLGLIIILLFLIVFVNVFSLCTVRQDSMYPQLHDGQKIILLKTKKIKRQEIFVFETEKIDSETGKNINLIKRAIAVGGDSLVFVAFDADYYADVYLYLDTGDGFLLLEEEEYLNQDKDYLFKPMLFGGMPNTFKSKIYMAHGETIEGFDFAAAKSEGLLQSYIINVPDGEIFAMGDNRNVSHDSRASDVGFVKKQDIVGRYIQKLDEGSFIERVLRLLYRDNAAG